MPFPRRPLPPKPRFFRACLTLVLAVLLIGSVAAPPARAQDAVSDFFSSLFGAHRAPQPRQQSHRPAHHPKPQPHATAIPVPSSAGPASPSGSSPAGPVVERPPASFFVAVIGDSEAGMLAQGLAEAFAVDTRVAIVNKAREDTGLVRDDFYDWPKAVAKLLEGPQHFDMAVIQIGINDNQKLRIDGGLEPLSKPFNEIYAKRVEEVASVFRDKNIPLVWVGLPIMRSESLSAAALVFNDIDRQYAGALGARYVDLWEAFSDVNSTYRASGPDIDGDIVRLRAVDGVHFNKSGARKAAHFVAPEIRRTLEAALHPSPAPQELPQGTPQASPNEAAPLSPAPGPAESAPQPEAAAPPPPKPLAGKIEPLTEPAVSPGGALADLPAAPASTPNAALTAPGRADDFRWPDK